MQNLKLNADIAAGLLFAGFGAWFAASAFSDLALGTTFRMGPGFFPAAVGLLLLVFGVVIAIKGWRVQNETVSLHDVPWRALILFPVGLLLFGLAMRPLGLVIALLILCLCASMAVKGMTPIRSVALSAAVTAVCVGIFSFGLDIGLPLLGDWLR